MIKKILSLLTAALVGFCFCADVCAVQYIGYDLSSKTELSVPSVSAKSAILINAEDGSVYFEKDPDTPMGMASTTKLMTALVITEKLDPEKTVTIPKEAVGTEGSSVYLSEGERLTVYELLCALLLSSANDAAAALAIVCSGSIEDFCTLMNEKAEEMGLKNTHFENPHGLYHENHYTTARELAMIGAEALRSELIAEIVSTKKMTISHDGEADKRLLVNHNRLLSGYDGAIGMKTGYTKKTGRTLVSAARRDGLTLIAVTLDAPDDWRDHKAMLDFGFANYETVTYYGVGEFSYALPLSDASKDSVILTNSEPLRATVKKGTPKPSVKVEGYGHFLIAPVKAGELFGSVTLYIGETEISSPLIISESIEGKTKPKKNIFQKIADLFKIGKR